MGSASGACWLLAPKMTGAEGHWTNGVVVEVDVGSAQKQRGPAAIPKPAKSLGFEGKVGVVCPVGRIVACASCE